MADGADSNRDESAANVGDAVFSEIGNETGQSSSFAEEMRDKVGAIHSHFDKDNDGYLNFEELRSLQLLTSGSDMKSQQYEVVCRLLNCEPGRGISLDALRLTYAAEGTDVDEDYCKVFPDRKEGGKVSTKSKADKEEEDDVIEVGEGGVDISS